MLTLFISKGEGPGPCNEELLTVFPSCCRGLERGHGDDDDVNEEGCVVHGEGDSPPSQLQAVRCVKNPVVHNEDRDTRQTLQFPCQRRWDL